MADTTATFERFEVVSDGDLHRLCAVFTTSAGQERIAVVPFTKGPAADAVQYLDDLLLVIETQLDSETRARLDEEKKNG